MNELVALMDQSQSLIDITDVGFVRYMYDEINWKNRLIGIKGPRGIGKTTLLLQYIKLNLDIKKTLYVTMDNLLFSGNKLFDVATMFAKMGGKFLFVDEIHKYANWSTEIKLIYDMQPELNVVFTGSSVLDISRGEEADLSRRAVMYEMRGLSFREYLMMYKGIKVPVYTLENILNNDVKLSLGTNRPLSVFAEYMEKGYYPFAADFDFTRRLMQVVSQTLEIDIPMYANLNISTSRKLKQLLGIIARSCPFKPNYQSLSQMLDVNRTQVKDYILYMEKTGLVGQLRDTTGGVRSLGKVEKVYLDNPSLAYVLSDGRPDIGNMRETFFYSQMRVKYDVLVSRVSDFEIGDCTFEIGGKGKGQKQIESATRGFVVKDDIEHGFGNTIPLYMFGLTY